ncbi:Uncharacterized protein SCF082_LOCUS40458 [Durusdinium trenchii]|uniref:Uncharacterized protein n=1 Tax=Durusdinium trenchii TaxID=1381693 RepID=A0ABP0QAX4_9DINO
MTNAVLVKGKRVARVAPVRAIGRAQVVPPSEVSSAAITDFLQTVHQGEKTIPGDVVSGKRLSKAQAGLRAKLLHAQTPRRVAGVHIEEKWTHMLLIGKLMLIAALSTTMIVCGFFGRSAAEADQLDPLMFKIIIPCGFAMLCSSLLGAYGAARVKQDLLEDDDGLRTVGQDLLEMYFHISFGFNLVLLPVSLSILADPDSFLNDGTFGDTEFYANVVSVLALLIAMLTFWACFATVQIVTVYEIAHSFLESFSTILVGLGAIGLVVSVSLFEFSQFLGIDDSSFDSSLAMILQSLMALCVVLIMLSVLGFGAALIESVLLLRVHMGGMLLLFLSLLSVIILFATADLGTTIENTCKPVLQVMAEEWWDDVVGCSKYGGAAMGARVEVYDPETDTYAYAISGVGTAVQCQSPDQVAFAWERYLAEMESGSVNETQGYEGCLNESCCHVLATHVRQHTSLLVFGVGTVLLACLVAIGADWLLFKHTAPQNERVKLVSRKRVRRLMGVMAFLVLGFAIALPLYLHNPARSVELQVIASQIAGASQSSSSTGGATGGGVANDDVVELSSCDNGRRDGNETDIDCGGPACEVKCAIGRSCLTDSDCLAAAICNATTLRCTPTPPLVQCNNGIRDGSESDVDCGGDECRILAQDSLGANARLCTIGAHCKVHADCDSGSCDAGVCASCQDGVKNTHEGDVDCGSPQCVDYYITFPEDTPANVSAAGNADDNGLCLDGRTCTSREQCSSGICSAATNTCVSCSNGVQDGDETGVDCGGKVCQKRCPIGVACQCQSDCITQRCSSNCASGTCDPGTCQPVFPVNASLDPETQLAFTHIYLECDDGEQSVHETDIDCGGSLCMEIGRPCSDGMRCEVDTDCASTHCFRGVCASCENGVQDGLETDVDCGGAFCQRQCAHNQRCRKSSDCREGSFCWTNATYTFTVQALIRYNLTQMLDDLVVPSLDTCQQVTHVDIETRDSASYEDGASLSDLFAPPSTLQPQPRAPDQLEQDDLEELLEQEDDANSTRRRLLDAEPQHPLPFAQMRGAKVGEVAGWRSRRRLIFGSVSPFEHTSMFDFWPYLCEAITTYEVVGGRFEVVSDNGAQVSWVPGKLDKLVVTRTYGSGTPLIRVHTTSCTTELADGVKLTRVDETAAECAWLDLSQVGVSTFLPSSVTVLRGTVQNADGDPIEGALVRVWAVRQGACSSRPDTGSTDCSTASCETYVNMFDTCTGEHGECCRWSETEGTAVSQCTGSSASNTELVEVSDANGEFAVILPSTETSQAVDVSYRLAFNVAHDDYETSQNSNVIISVGAQATLEHTTLIAAPTPACACENDLVADNIAEETLVCIDLATDHCVARVASSCSSLPGHRLCDATRTAQPTVSNPAASPPPRLAQNNLVSTVDLSANWELDMTLRLHYVSGNWQNILQVGDSYKVRLPGLWIRPGENRLHVRVSRTGNWNDGCDPAMRLELEQDYHIHVEVFMDVLKVFIDDMEAPVCTRTFPKPFVPQGEQPLFMANPGWEEPAYVTVTGLVVADIVERPTPAPTMPTELIVQGHVDRYVTVGANWKLSFQLTIWEEAFPQFGSILSVGSIKTVRLPAVMLWPHTNTLHITVSTTASWTEACDPAFTKLTTGRPYKIEIEVFDRAMRVFYDSEEVCSATLLGDVQTLGSQPMYVSNPWYAAAPVTVSHIQMSNITDRVVVPPPVIPQLVKDNYVSDVTLGTDWRMAFTVAVFDTFPKWTNLLHVGNKNRQRVPLVAAYPGQTRLHFRVSTDYNWNEGCDPELHLTPGQAYDVTVEHFGGVLTIWYDNVEVCSRSLQGSFKEYGVRKLYVADPWHEPARATLDDLVFENITGRPTQAPVTPIPELVASTSVGTVDLGPHWFLELDVTVYDVGSWFMSLVHVGDTDAERIPAIFVRPWEPKLAFRISTTKTRNVRCDADFELVMGQVYHITIRVTKGHTWIVELGGQMVCNQELDSPPAMLGPRPIYVSDPWYAPAKANVENLVIANQPCTTCSQATVRVHCDNKLRFRHYELVSGELVLQTTPHGANDFDFADWRVAWTATLPITEFTRFEFECYDVGVVGGFVAVVEACAGIRARSNLIPNRLSKQRPHVVPVSFSKPSTIQVALQVALKSTLHQPFGQPNQGTELKPFTSSHPKSVAKPDARTFAFSNHVSDHIPDSADTVTDQCADGVADKVTHVADKVAHQGTHNQSHDRTNANSVQGADKKPFDESKQGTQLKPKQSAYESTVHQSVNQSHSKSKPRSVCKPKQSSIAVSEQGTVSITFVETEPILAVSFDSGENDFAWLETTYEGIVEIVDDTSAKVADTKDFSAVSMFRGVWNETFSLEVAAIGGCAIDNDATKRAIAEARCGKILADRSACDVSFSVSGSTITISIGVEINTFGDARILDRQQAAPSYTIGVGLLVERLRASPHGCWSSYSEIHGPVDVVSTGRYEFMVTITNYFVGDENLKIQGMQQELDRLLVQEAHNDPEIDRLFPTLDNAKVDICPPQRLCSGRGRCCNAESQYEIDCAYTSYGLCVCNSGWTGFDCIVEESTLPFPLGPVGEAQTEADEADSLRCIPRDSFGGEGAAQEILELCELPDACVENELTCVLESSTSIDYGNAKTGCPEGDWITVFRQFDCQVTLNLGRNWIDSLFHLTSKWRYDIGGVPYLYYRFLAEQAQVPEGYSPYSLMLDNWASLDGAHLINEHFALYGSGADLEDDTGRWEWSNYDDFVGFPRDARPLTEGSAAYKRSFYFKWAKAHCLVASHKNPYVQEFSFALCIPSASEARLEAANAVAAASSASATTVTLQGTVEDMQTGVGVEARVSLYKGHVMTTDGSTSTTTPFAEQDVVLTLDSSEEKTARVTSCISSLSSGGSEEGTSVVHHRSTFSFPNLSPGQYSVVVAYREGLAAAAGQSLVTENLAFKARVVHVDLVDDESERDLTIKVQREIPRGSMMLVMEAVATDVDLVVQFPVGSEENSLCVVSSKMLSDGACGCGGAYLVRADDRVGPDGKAVQAIYFEGLVETSYKVFLSRSKPVAASTFKRHRDDGRCGPDWVLPSGEAAECPPIPVVWEDGIRSLRPCCHILDGQCGATERHCRTRWSIDYRLFLDDGWKSQVRSDLRCNRPDKLFDFEEGSKVATCPEDAPCCSPAAKCGALQYHCESPRSIDYRDKYLGSVVTTGQLPLEESGASVAVYTSQGMAPIKTFSLADPLEPLNYFDGHDFATGVASASATYARLFCVDAERSEPRLHEFPSPTYFEWKGQMLSMSKSCPATSDCTFVRISGFRASFERADGGWTPALDGSFLRRFRAATQTFKARVGHGVSLDGACRIRVVDPKDGVSRWNIRNLDGGAKACIAVCDEMETCDATFVFEYIGWSSQERELRCTFHKSVHQCGGVRPWRFRETKEYTVYEKERVGSAVPSVWFTKTDSLFVNDPAQRVELYMDAATSSWYADNDLTPANGYFATAPSNGDGQIPPLSSWRYLTDFEAGTRSLHTHELKVKEIVDDCRVGGNFPTVNETATSQGCDCTWSTGRQNCFGMDRCSAFQLRLRGTNICLEASVEKSTVLSNLCAIDGAKQMFIFNSGKQRLEARIGEDWFVVDNEFKLHHVTLASQELPSPQLEVPGIAFSQDGKLCKASGAVEVQSYAEAEAALFERSCVFLADAPGDTPLWVEADRESIWSEFTVA